MNYKVISLDKTPSTQLYAHELVAQNRAADHIAIVADMQTAGRGRFRREWMSPPGNLYTSLVMADENRDPRLSYVAAVAVAETLISFGINPQIKWPNDVLVDGKKIAGILIEYAKDFVIIGIGINIKSNPVLEKYETTRVDNFADVSRDEIFGVLIKNLDIWMRRDFAIVRNRWTELAIGLNGVIKYRGQMLQMVGINENGALVLRRGAEYIMTYGDEISI